MGSAVDPTAALSCKDRAACGETPPEFRAVRHGVICVFSKQRGQDWEGKEKTEELSDKFK